MSPLAAIFLFLHVMGAIAAFGPSFVMPIIASQARKMPSGALFGLKLSDVIERRLIIPLGLFQAVTGIGLIVTVGFDLTATHWLAAGIVLYVIAISFAILVQAKTVESMIHVIEALPAPGAGHPARTAPGRIHGTCQARPAGRHPAVGAARPDRLLHVGQAAVLGGRLAGLGRDRDGATRRRAGLATPLHPRPWPRCRSGCSPSGRVVGRQDVLGEAGDPAPAGDRGDDRRAIADRGLAQRGDR